MQNNKSLHPRDRKLKYANLLDVWNTWHRHYLNSPFPVAFQRYEDLLFHTSDATKEVCRLESSTKVTIFERAAKSHTFQTEVHSRLHMINAYGQRETACHGLSIEDVRWVEDRLDPELMGMFGYGQDLVHFCFD
jgi:hypothetical protein